MALSQWETLTEEQREDWMLKGSQRSKKQRGQQGKETENLTRDAIGYVKEAVAWNSNNGVPLCDKVCCWKGRFLLVECKETTLRKLPFSCITDSEHIALQAIERPPVRGLGLVVIRYLTRKNPPQGFMLTYTEWLMHKAQQRFQYFDLDNPPLWFRRFSWAHIRHAHDIGQPSPFEQEIDRIFLGRPLLEQAGEHGRPI